MSKDLENGFQVCQSKNDTQNRSPTKRDIEACIFFHGNSKNQYLTCIDHYLSNVTLVLGSLD